MLSSSTASHFNLKVKVPATGIPMGSKGPTGPLGSMDLCDPLAFGTHGRWNPWAPGNYGPFGPGPLRLRLRLVHNVSSLGAHGPLAPLGPRAHFYIKLIKNIETD